MGSIDQEPHVIASTAYSVPKSAAGVYKHGILENPLISKDLPLEVRNGVGSINFTGSDDPSLPVNWRFTEAVSSLKALEAALVDVILQRRHGIQPHQITINTDHASLFLFSTLLWTIDPEGENIQASNLRQANPKLFQYFPSCDKHRMNSSTHRNLATNIYKCADGRFFQAHGSLNPTPTLQNVGLPAELDVGSYEQGVEIFQKAFGKIGSEKLQAITDETRQAGTICSTTDEYLQSEHGRANEHVGLWEIHGRPNANQVPCWFESSNVQADPSRPLAGLKVVDLTRIIAGPSITRSLAELGASVMRCTAPHLPDVVSLQADLNWGKWNCSLDLRVQKDCEQLRRLISEADVVVQGYRPGVLDKYGFGQEDIIDMCKGRNKGVIYVRENCYGWHGPWKDRSGWQQIADANTGLSHSFGEAMGHGDPVTPLFPHSDYCTGIAGSCAVLLAILRRAEGGGSYCIDLALNYYSAWLIRSVGTYPTDVFAKIWAEHDNTVYQHWHNNGVSVPQVLGRLRSGPARKRLFRPEFFEERVSPSVFGDKKFRCVKGVADWHGVVKLGYNVGTRGNGVDAPKWPDDLMQEVIA
ncbi:CoA-transferase family III domain-containing protein [Fusarium solani]|uniref:CoA-transferase family III domain-containing protein n=1 Tax=Fusarium solani TaxID=169388 RepID=A0A9P9R776_FUSSL|nr:CoA-transferase family III domain-containing protein [Fusarium solani]KAH7268179.1 CoA-transferase family III domain-containing protein [Fusarium solani]